MIDNTSEEDRREINIVIFLADLDETPKSTALTEIRNSFEKYINEGFIRVIIAPKEYYPPLWNLRKKFGDNPKRIFWRSKQNIDFAFLMCYCHGLSQYYLHLEDDVLPAPSFYHKLRDFISSIKIAWPILDVSYQGHVAKVYHGNDLENLATYFYLMYDEMPVDWLIIFWRQIKYDRPYKEEFIFPPASLFQHIGSESSFEENKNRGKSIEEYFDRYDVKYKGLNPSASVRSEMISSLGQPQDVYNKGYGYFWAKDVKKDDFITVVFTSVVTVRKVFVDTGSYTAPKDQLQSAVLQASLNNIKEQQTTGSSECKNFETIADFKKGKVEVTFDGGKSMTCLRILVLSTQETWVFFREIDVWLV